MRSAGVMVFTGLVELLIMQGTAQLFGDPLRWERIAIAALLSGVCSGISLLHQFRFLGSIWWHLVLVPLFGLLAFGLEREGLLRCGIYCLLHIGLDAVSCALGQGKLWLLPLGLALLGAAYRILCGGRYIPLEIRYRGAAARLMALQDSGNTLRDPLTGERVVVIGAEAAQQLTGLTAQQLSKPLEAVGKRALPGLRLLPYRTVGSDSGLMLAMRFPYVRIGCRRGSALVAFSPAALGGKRYQALTGGIY